MDGRAILAALVLAISACTEQSAKSPAPPDNAVIVASVREILKSADSSAERICVIKNRLVSTQKPPVSHEMFDDAIRASLIGLDARITTDVQDCEGERFKSSPRKLILEYLSVDAVSLERLLNDMGSSSGGVPENTRKAYSDLRQRWDAGHVIGFAGFANCGAKLYLLDFGPAADPLVVKEKKIVGDTSCTESQNTLSMF